MTRILILTIAALAGCSTMGLEKLSPEQMDKMNGLAGCTYVKSLLYGELGQMVVSNDSVRKGATNQFKVSINPSAGCATVIEGDVGVASPAAPKGAVGAAAAPTAPPVLSNCYRSGPPPGTLVCEVR